LGLLLALCLCLSAFGASHIIYDDGLNNGWQNYSFNANINFSNTPGQSGSNSTGVTITGAYGALYLNHTNFDISAYTNLTFWINGGTTGGQALQIKGRLNNVEQTAYFLPASAA